MVRNEQVQKPQKGCLGRFGVSALVGWGRARVD